MQKYYKTATGEMATGTQARGPVRTKVAEKNII